MWWNINIEKIVNNRNRVEMKRAVVKAKNEAWEERYVGSSRST